MIVPTHFTWIKVACVLADLLAVGVVLFGPWRWPRWARGGRIGLRRLGWAGAGAGVVFVAALPGAHRLGVNFFGQIHLLYLNLMIVLPLTAISILAAGRRASRLARGLAVLGVAVVPLGIYAGYIEPFRLKVERTTIPVRPARAGHGTVRIGVLADLPPGQVTDYERGAVTRLMDLRPDVILLAGDYFEGTRAQFKTELPALRELFGRLSAPGGVYAVLGNIDREDEVRRAMAGTRIRLLVNEAIQVTVGDRIVTILGIDMVRHSRQAWPLVDSWEASGEPDDIHLLLSHVPDAVLALNDHSRIDLVISGHTHGGQVRLPFLGPFLKLSDVPGFVAAGGYHELNGNGIYVSRGVGCERGQAPQIRFLCPPELSLLEMGGPPRK